MEVAEDWEKNVFERLINDFNNQQLSKLMYSNGKALQLKATYMAERSIPDEL